MTENHSASRKRAELEFSKIQSSPSARERAFEEIDVLRAAGAEKTLKLREARLARDQQDKEARDARLTSGLPKTP